MKLKTRKNIVSSFRKAPKRSESAILPALSVKSKSIRIASAAGAPSALEFRSVSQSVDEAIVISDARGNIIFWNEGARKIFGYAESHILGKPLALLIPIGTDDLRAGKLEQVLFSRASPIDGKTHELRGIRANGSQFPVELSLLTWSIGSSVFFTTIIRDITERKRLQKGILEISGREQRRIGQDLHDDLCQRLTAVTLLIEILEKKLCDKSLEESADASEIHRLVALAVVQTRLLAKGLLPVELEAHGLMAALNELAFATQQFTHIACRVKCQKPVLVLDREVAMHLYRIAQEAVANAVKHARAKRIVIKLSKNGPQIALSISDDGVGISKGFWNKTGLGLSIMNSRAETINATLQIRRAYKGGTEVTCSLREPLALSVKTAGPVGRKKRHENHPSKQAKGA